MSIVNIVKEPEYYYPAGMAEQDGLMTYQESQKLDNIPTPSSIVTKSSTAGLLKNDGTVDSNSYVKKSDLEEIKTASGNPITLTDAIAGNAIEVSAEIVASQDLHGYDKPWVWGAGKNKLPFNIATIKSLNTSGTWNDNVYTKSGVSVTVSDDGTYNVVSDGTLSDTFIFYLGDISGNGLILNGCPSGGSDNTYKIQAFKSGASFNDYGNGVNITDNDSRSYRIVVYASAGAINKIFKPMLSSEGGTFAPYTNICPITGFSSVTITNVDSESHTATVTVSLGSTVYGGTLNLTTGELTITHASVTLDGSNDEVWDVSANRFRCKSLPANCIDSASTINGISNLYKANTADNIFANRQTANFVGFAISKTELLVVDNVNFANDDLSAYKTYLASNNLQVVYTLATPQTIQLTPTQLTMLKGYNRLSSDGGGDIALEYLPDNALNELYKKVNDETDTKIGSLDASDVDALPDSVIIATEFSEETTYVKNKYVIYNGVIYRCTEYHAAGAWNASHFTPVSVCDELFDAGSFNKFCGNADYDGTTEYKVDHSYVHQGSSNIPDYPSDGKAGTTNRFGILKTMRIETGYIFQTLIVSYEGEPSGDDPTIKSKFYYRSAIRIDGTYVWGNWYEITGTEIV